MSEMRSLSWVTVAFSSCIVIYGLKLLGGFTELNGEKG